MPLNENEYKKIEYEAIQLFIDKLRESNIICGIKIFDKIDYYTIFLNDKKESELNVISDISYDVDMKFEKHLYKPINCKYLYRWFKDDNEIQESIEKGRTKDITEYFKISYVSKNLLPTNDIPPILNNSKPEYIGENDEYEYCYAA